MHLLIRFRTTGVTVGHVDDDGLTKYPNAGQYSVYDVRNDDLEVEGHADVEDGATDIVATGWWLVEVLIMKGCTSSE
jgi:hypothetical protein